MREALANLLRLRWGLVLVAQAAPRLALASAVLAAAQAAVPVGLLLLVKGLVDSVAALGRSAEPAASLGEAAVWAALIGVVGLVSAGLGAAAAWTQEALSLQLTDHVHQLIHRKSVELDLGYFETPEYHDHLFRAQGEGAYRPARVVSGLLRLASGVLSGGAVAGLLLLLDPWLFVLLAAAAVPLLVVRIRHSKRLHQWHRERTHSERLAGIYDWMLTHVQFAKEVRLFGLGRYLTERHQQLRAAVRRERLSLARRRALADLGAQTGVALATFAALLLILHRVSRGAISLGSMVMYYQALQRLVESAQQTVSAVAELHEDGLFLRHLEEFLEQRPRIVDPVEPQPLQLPLRRGLALENVRFRYPGAAGWVLDDVSLELRPGEVAALVGENGAGKTTLVKLLCRLYDPESGRLTLGGVDLRSYRVSELRATIGVTFQDFVHYPLTARENIGFGAVERMHEEGAISSAAQWAGAETVLAALPQGLDTPLGRWFEGGRELSVGEWQKLALARARFRGAQLLVLDEPSSALDARAEAELFERIRELLEGSTALLISHRFSSVSVADRIFVLKAGRLVEQGTHQELMQRDGEYATMYRLQASHYR